MSDRNMFIKTWWSQISDSCNENHWKGHEEVESAANVKANEKGFNTKKKEKFNADKEEGFDAEEEEEFNAEEEKGFYATEKEGFNADKEFNSAQEESDNDDGVESEDRDFVTPKALSEDPKWLLGYVKRRDEGEKWGPEKHNGHPASSKENRHWLESPNAQTHWFKGAVKGDKGIPQGSWAITRGCSKGKHKQGSIDHWL